MNGLDLREGLLGQLAGLEEEQLGIAEHGSQGVVDVVLHVGHVAPERGELFVVRGFAFGVAREPQSLGAAQRFARDQ